MYQIVSRKPPRHPSHALRMPPFAASRWHGAAVEVLRDFTKRQLLVPQRSDQSDGLLLRFDRHVHAAVLLATVDHASGRTKAKRDTAEQDATVPRCVESTLRTF